ncbi:hypothetical protein RJ640_017669 [Escallonia rubra]|uniref:Uncharacterized protein n=1 Tax=Escallonia rubra TaxID=112253 RepID=A0AA88ULC1_9ASTE|nr:hypothetical protein RJ640_017669 [Escallonia rubra]
MIFRGGAGVERADEGELVGLGSTHVHASEQRESLYGMTLLDRARNDGCPRHHVLVSHFVEQLEGVWKMAAFGVHVEEIVAEVEGREKGLLDEFGVHGFVVPQVESLDDGAENARGLFDLCSGGPSKALRVLQTMRVWIEATDKIVVSFSAPCLLVLKRNFLKYFADKFCYNCILHWTKVVSGKHSHHATSVKCPLCKIESSSIIHGYDGMSFQQCYVNQDLGNSVFFSRAHKYRLQCYYIKPGTLSGEFNVSRYWKSYKYLQPNRWFYSWLKREIQALIQEEDVDIVVHHILGVTDSFRRNTQKFPQSSPETKQEEFKALVSKAAKPFLAGRTDQFLDEVELFLASGLNIDAYDRVYIQHLGWNIPDITGEDKEEKSHEHTHLVPYLHILDDDIDETD